MKLNLIKGKNQEGKIHIIGWNFEAETKQEEVDLSHVRNAIFFGLDDTHPEYAGREDNPDTNLVKRIWYKIPKEVNNVNSGKLICNNPNYEYFKKGY